MDRPAGRHKRHRLFCRGQAGMVHAEDAPPARRRPGALAVCARLGEEVADRLLRPGFRGRIGHVDRHQRDRAPEEEDPGLRAVDFHGELGGRPKRIGGHHLAGPREIDQVQNVAAVPRHAI